MRGHRINEWLHLLYLQLQYDIKNDLLQEKSAPLLLLTLPQGLCFNRRITTRLPLFHLNSIRNRFVLQAKKLLGLDLSKPFAHQARLELFTPLFSQVLKR